jgi:glycosyltransferase involved in cell wall biosynthesis
MQDTTLTFVAAPDGLGRGGLHLYQGDTHFGLRPYLAPSWPITPVAMPLMESSWNDILDEVRPDVIHLQHLLNHPIGLIERLVTSDIPVVVSVHDHYFICPDYTLMNCPGSDQCDACFVRKFHTGHADYQKYRRQIFDNALRKAAAVIAPSEDTSRRLREVYPGLSVTVIPHGSRPVGARTPAQRALRQPDEPVKFGFIGNLTQHKGIEILTSAFARAVRISPCELHIWGVINNSYKTICNKPHVYYHGPYSSETLGEITQLIDIGVIPSIVPETFCYTLSELSSAGLPCLVADFGSLGERVIHDVNGWKVTPGDVTAWEAALVRLASDPRLLETIHSSVAVRSLEAMCGDYARIYAGVCAPRESSLEA